MVFIILGIVIAIAAFIFVWPFASRGKITPCIILIALGTAALIFSMVFIVKNIKTDKAQNMGNIVVEQLV